MDTDSNEVEIQIVMRSTYRYYINGVDIDSNGVDTFMSLILEIDTDSNDVLISLV